jgi:hypothetical protein
MGHGSGEARFGNGGVTVLRPSTGGGNSRHAAAHRWFPPRRLHLIDIENLVGNSRPPSLNAVRRMRDMYADHLAFGAMDQVVVAASCYAALESAAFGWPHARYRAWYGVDGADLALLDVLRHEDIAERFTDVAIGSGDHLFATEAKRLADRGVHVTVVSWRCCLSRRLAEAADDVILFDALAEAA